MSISPFTAAGVAAALALGALVIGVQASHPALGAATSMSATAEDTRDLLDGTWLREYQDDGVKVRHVLTLDPHGTFREAGRVIDLQGRVTRYEHQGIWVYDGVNLKRKYSLVNGQPPSRLNLPFATFQIAFQSRNDFVGVDHIHGRRIHYERVAPDTEP